MPGRDLIATLQATNRNAEALQQIALIPPAVRKQLESDIEFVQTEASLYAASGDTPHAIEYMNRVQAHYARLKTRRRPISRFRMRGCSTTPRTIAPSIRR